LSEEEDFDYLTITCEDKDLKKHTILNINQMEEARLIKQLNLGIIKYKDLPQHMCETSSIIITAIKNHIDVPKKFYDDFNIMLSVVKINGMLLWKVSDRLIQNYYIQVWSLQVFFLLTNKLNNQRLSPLK
jgi:hypothetical protein